MSLRPGDRLGPYEVQSLIGAGGMGEVYKARDTRLDRTVAIKVLPPDLAADPERRQRFEREAKTISALNHPHVCTLHDVGSAGSPRPGSPAVDFLVMEYLDGETLAERLRKGPIPQDLVLRCAIEIADALHAAHRQGVVHRDLKPGNVMLTEAGVKVLDFGLAKLTRPGEADVDLSTASTESVALTGAGTIVGTVRYMAPEQLEHKAVDARADLFVLGAVIHEMATGRPAFEGESTAALIAAILDHTPPPISALSPATPPGLDRVVARCLEKDPVARWANATEVGQQLRGIAERERVAGGRGKGPEVPEGLAAGPAAAEVRRASLRVAAAVGTVAVALVLGSLVVPTLRDLREQLLRGRAEPFESIAVLPLTSHSSDSEQEYFADGMTEALINDLGRIGVSRVISRTTAMQYKGVSRPVAEIGRELDVDAVIEGSVWRAGDRVRITVQLIDARRDRQMWADAYERDLRDVLLLQRDVARSIAEQIRVQVSPEEAVRLASEKPVDSDAYEAYLKARYHRARWVGYDEETDKALQYYQQALQHDPTLALAYAGLAEIYSIRQHILGLPQHEASNKAREAALTAIEIDGTLSEAHAALGMVFENEWNWVGSEREYRRAIDLNPSSTVAHKWYANLLRTLGRLDEALAEIRYAQRLDPLDLSTKTMVGWVLFNEHRYDDAIAQWNQVLELDPGYRLAIYNRGMAYAMKGLYDDAITDAERVVSPRTPGSGVPAGFVASLAVYHAKAGHRSEAVALREDLKRRGQLEPLVASWIALGFGDEEEAVHWLERSHEERDPALPSFTSEPWCDPLRELPRFQALRDKMGLK